MDTRYRRLASFCSIGMSLLMLFSVSSCAAENMVMEKSEPTARFVLNHMLEEGGVRTNYLDGTRVYEFATGSDVLSESQGLLMRYAVVVEDQILFEQAHEYVQDNLLLDDTLISYRYSEEYRLFPMNAIVDDFRIIRALLEAAQVFEEESYKSRALEYAEKIYDVCVVDGNLRDFYDAKAKAVSGTLRMCYVDFKTLSALSAYDDRWVPILEKGLALVKSSYLGDTFPLFASSYSYETASYSTEDIDTVQALLVALHLAEMGECPTETIHFVKRQVESGTLWGAYSVGGAPASDVQSAAIYALAAMLGTELGDWELREAAIVKMRKFRIEEVEHPLYGAYANPETKEAFSFDNLCAMLTEEYEDV
ncbi:hypothetical protein LJC49_06185 [Ruminococcaceae bacterium OttesenSCG-928-I18]|nr:hypothetical protein [Ruminococcaceae bacterium OttesenSCG-928-I18]